MTFVDTSALAIASPPVQVSPGALTQIPFPADQLPKRSIPISYPYVVIVNSSPYALLVSQSGVLTQIAAYTEDLLELQIADGSRPITILAQPGSATIATGVDMTVYATWYSTPPGGEYPAAIGAGTIAIGTNSGLPGGSFDGTVPFGSFDVAPMPSWVQTVAVQAQVVPPNGVYVIVNYTTSGGFIFSGTLSNAQILYVPVNGQPVTFTLLTSGGNLIGVWPVFGLTTAITAPIIQPFGGGNSGGVPHGPQPRAEVTAAAGATPTMIIAPPFGMQVRLRCWSWQFAVAPAAGGQLLLRGLSTGNPTLIRHEVPGTVNDPGSPIPMDVWVPDFLNASSQNQPDGIRIDNGTTQTVTATLAYELWPTNLEPV
jgi:hypothetical protein